MKGYVLRSFLGSRKRTIISMLVFYESKNVEDIWDLGAFWWIFELEDFVAE